MATKRYNQQTFYATINGKLLTFLAWTTSTRSGFCHTIYDMEHEEATKVSYYNRTWERFEYETALRRAIEKCPKSMREQLNEQIIEHKFAEENERCERISSSFITAYNALSDERQKQLANSGIEMHNEDDVKSVTSIMRMMSVIDTCMEQAPRKEVLE